MATTLADLMNKGGGKPAPTEAPAEPAEAATPLVDMRAGQPDFQDVVPMHGGLLVEIEAVCCGALMKVRFTGGVTPREAVDYLRAHDAATKFRDDFPAKGFGGGKRETKVARALVINIDVRDSGKFINITATTGTDDLSIHVGKKGADEWLPKLEALSKLGDRNLGKIRSAFENKGSATVVLQEAEQFGVKYWTTDDGKAFLEEMVVEAPAAAAEEGGAA